SPVLMGEDRDRSRIGPGILGIENASEQRMDLHVAEVIVGDESDTLVWKTLDACRKARIFGNESLEGPAVRAIEVDCRRREGADDAVLRNLGQPDKCFHSRNLIPMHDRRIEDLKQRQIRPDSERKDSDRAQRKARRAPEAADGIEEVLPKLFE